MNATSNRCILRRAKKISPLFALDIPQIVLSTLGCLPAFSPEVGHHTQDFIPGKPANL